LREGYLWSTIVEDFLRVYRRLAARPEAVSQKSKTEVKV
jgi:hypothetical protein